MTISFLYLNAISSVGGIQKFNTNVISALDIIGKENYHSIYLLSLHDTHIPNKFDINFKSANHSKIVFFFYALGSLFKSDIIFLGHCNLTFPITLLNKFFFKKKIYLFVHGIEVWKKLPTHKIKAINLCNKLLSVSNFTAKKAMTMLSINPDKVSIFHNTLAPINTFAIATHKSALLMSKYGLSEKDQILLTITRLSNTEKNKGYEKVLEALPNLLLKHPHLKYLLAGKVDDYEKVRIQKLIEKLGIADAVILTGFIADEELTAHYQLCDLFIMPSTKEGFGIVFIEATACGKPVIGGNQDGSVEALLHGQLGYIVNPEVAQEITQAIDEFLCNQWPSALTDGIRLRQLTIENFGFEKMKQNLEALIDP